MKIIVHLGAHKTATTHLQETLKRGRSTFGERGLYVWDNLAFRQDILQKIHGPVEPFSLVHLIHKLFPSKFSDVPIFKRFSDILSQLSNKYDRVIISEENLLGNTNDIYHTDNLYGLIGKRISIIQSLMGDYQVEYFLAIRNLATFLPSIYCESLLWKRFRPFEDIYHKRSPEELSWIPLISALRDGLTGRKLTVWDYEGYKANAKLIIETMTGMDASGIDLLAGHTLRRGFSQNAIKVISACPSRGRTYKNRMENIERIVKANPISDSNPKFSPFLPEVVDSLTKKYIEELKTIDKMPGVKLLKMKRSAANNTVNES